MDHSPLESPRTEISSHQPNWEKLAAPLRDKYHLIDDPVTIGPYRWELLRPRSADELISEEDFARDERLPYWCEVWPSSVVLARHLESTAAEGRRLLELGCGIAVSSLVAATGGYQVLASDYYEETGTFIRINQLRNSLPTIDFRMIDWRDWPADLGTFDVVIAADVLYEKAYPQLVAESIARALAPGGVAWVTDPQRAVAREFPAACQRAGLLIERLSHGPCEQGGVCHTVDLFEIRRPTL